MEKIRNRDGINSDPNGKNSDPGWKKFGSGMEKIRIRNKHHRIRTTTVSVLPVERGWKGVVGQKDGKAGLEVHTLFLLPPQLLQAPSKHGSTVSSAAPTQGEGTLHPLPEPGSVVIRRGFCPTPPLLPPPHSEIAEYAKPNHLPQTLLLSTTDSNCQSGTDFSSRGHYTHLAGAFEFCGRIFG
jgi:hypothetical protein